MSKTVLFVPHNHFDPTWRRCFDRLAEYGGMTVRSYAEVEDLCISKWLELAPQGYTFSEGQVAVLRKYLERHPDKKDLLRQYAGDGRLDVMLAGEVIQDSNMPVAEGLVRNFLVAMPFYKDLVGQDHRGLRLGWVADAFGNSPNMPQLLRGVGAECICFTTYRVCSGDVWTGIDGTSILCYDWFPAVRAGAYENHPPCEHCQGKGCDTCQGAGLRIIGGFDADAVRQAIEQAIAKEGDWAAVFLTTEELLPDPQIVGIIDDLNRQYAGRCTIRFANPSDIFEAHLPAMRKTLASQEPVVEDLNPAMPGCLVSRIQCKQRTRAISYKILAAEAALANRAWRQGEPAAPPAEFTRAWQHVAFNQFHDAITGTHVDSAYTELMDMLDEAEQIADQHTPKIRARKGSHKFTEVTQPVAEARVGPFDIRFDRKGILSILRDGQDVFGTWRPAWRACREVRIGELTLESDFGDAWGKRIAAFGSDKCDITAVPLGNYQDRVETAPTAIRWHGRYSGSDPKVRKLKWTVTMSLSPDGRRLDFVTDVDWDTHSRRLRVLFPVASQEDTATYEVPFGFIDRKFEADKIDYSQWRSNTMEWPALHWVRKRIDERRGVALLNRGLPCNRWMPGRLDLSLLRSPEWSFCAVEPANYEFWDIDGQRDTGKHRFEYSLWPYYDGLAEGELTRTGYAYNVLVPLALPFGVSGDVVVTAFKLAEDGSGWILRLQEASGRGTTVALDFAEPRQVTRTNQLEQPQGETAGTQHYEIPLHKHGILTLRIR